MRVILVKVSRLVWYGEICMEDKEQSLKVDLSLKNHDIIERSYTFEEKYMLIIQNGDVSGMHKLLLDNGSLKEGNDELLSHIEHRLPHDRLRYRKNNCVILNTLSRTAARRGGLPSVHLHTISEKFAIMIEAATTIDYILYTLQPSIAIEYSEAVALFSTEGYSSSIKEVINYITSNLTVDITISELAERYHVSPSTLSRKFKDDTKMSISNYVNYQRIELAKYYFEKGEESITEVSYNTGYNDSSYFTKVFKRVTGILPTDYIKSIKSTKEK